LQLEKPNRRKGEKGEGRGEAPERRVYKAEIRPHLKREGAVPGARGGGQTTLRVQIHLKIKALSGDSNQLLTCTREPLGGSKSLVRKQLEGSHVGKQNARSFFPRRLKGCL